MANWESTNWLFFVLFKSAETVYKLKKIEKKTFTWQDGNLCLNMKNPHKGYNTSHL